MGKKWHFTIKQTLDVGIKQKNKKKINNMITYENWDV